MNKVEPHPLSRNFIWADREGPFRTVTTAQAESWNANGFFLLRDVIDTAQIDRLVAELDPLDAQTEDYLRARGGRAGISRSGELTFTIHAVLRSAVARAFTRAALFANLCLDLLGPDCRLYWDQAVYKKPGNPEEFPWHQDNGYNFVEPQDYLTCWIPLTPATVDNGCPWVVPGLHRRGTLRHHATELGFRCLEVADDPVPVEADPGDVVVFSSLTPHRTGPNLTDRPRKAYIVQYAHAGAEMISADGARRTPQQDPGRQFPVTSGGDPVSA
jgi:phytanoyl-CoA hydroxylase